MDFITTLIVALSPPFVIVIHDLNASNLDAVDAVFTDIHEASTVVTCRVDLERNSRNLCQFN